MNPYLSEENEIILDNSLSENTAYKELMSSSTGYNLADDFTNADIDWESSLNRANISLFDNPPPNYPYSLIKWRKCMQLADPEGARKYMFGKIKNLYRTAARCITDSRSIIFCVLPVDTWDINHDNCYIFEYYDIGRKIEIYINVRDVDSVQFSFIDEFRTKYTKIDNINYLERYIREV